MFPFSTGFSHRRRSGPEEEEPHDPGGRCGDGKGGGKVDAGDPLHLFSQIGGHWFLQGEESYQQGGEEGGESAVEEFSGDISSDGKPAAAEEGENLAVDGEPGPAQHEGRHGHAPRHATRAGEGPDAGGEFDGPGEEPLGPFLGKTQWGEQDAQQPGERREGPGEKEQTDDHGKKDHKGTDIQGGEEGVLHRSGKGGGKPLRLELGGHPGLAAFFAPPVKSEKQPHTDGCGGVRQGEEDAHPAAGEYARPHYAQNKGRAGVVAEGKEALSLGLGAHPLLVEAQGRPGPYGVAAHKARTKAEAQAPGTLKSGRMSPSSARPM